MMVENWVECVAHRLLKTNSSDVSEEDTLN